MHGSLFITKRDTRTSRVPRNKPDVQLTFLLKGQREGKHIVFRFLLSMPYKPL